MTKDSRPTPNTHLGEVVWYADMFFGTMLAVCQGLLGLRGPQRPDLHFLSAEHHSVNDLRDYFNEIKLQSGMLALELFTGDCGSIIAVIETTVPYGEELTDQMLLNLIDDFKEHVRGLPLVEPEKREGAMWTDEDVKRGYCEEANQLYVKAMELLSAVGLAMPEELPDDTQKDPNDSEF